MPDATSLHHCLQNHHQYRIILSWIRSLNIDRPVVNLIIFLFYFPLNILHYEYIVSKCVVLLKLHGCVVSHMQVLATTLLSLHNIKYSFCWILQLKAYNFSYSFLRQWCRDEHQALTGILTEQKFISDCRYRVIESSSLVPVLFREVFSHTYIYFFHLLVNGFLLHVSVLFFS